MFTDASSQFQSADPLAHATRDVVLDSGAFHWAIEEMKWTGFQIEIVSITCFAVEFAAHGEMNIVSDYNIR